MSQRTLGETLKQIKQDTSHLNNTQLQAIGVQHKTGECKSCKEKPAVYKIVELCHTCYSRQRRQELKLVRYACQLCDKKDQMSPIYFVKCEECKLQFHNKCYCDLGLDTVNVNAQISMYNSRHQTNSTPTVDSCIICHLKKKSVGVKKEFCFNIMNVKRRTGEFKSLSKDRQRVILKDIIPFIDRILEKLTDSNDDKIYLLNQICQAINGSTSSYDMNHCVVDVLLKLYYRILNSPHCRTEKKIEWLNLLLGPLSINFKRNDLEGYCKLSVSSYRFSSSRCFIVQLWFDSFPQIPRIRIKQATSTDALDIAFSVIAQRTNRTAEHISVLPATNGSQLVPVQRRDCSATTLWDCYNLQVPKTPLKMSKSTFRKFTKITTSKQIGSYSCGDNQLTLGKENIKDIIMFTKQALENSCIDLQIFNAMKHFEKYIYNYCTKEWCESQSSNNTENS